MKILEFIALIACFYISLVGDLFKKSTMEFPFPDFNHLYDETIF